MAQGSSGRVVIDIDPELKKDIYRQLRARGSNMREWFLAMVHRELTTERNGNGEEAHRESAASAAQPFSVNGSGAPR